MFFKIFSELCEKSGTTPNAVAKKLNLSSGSVTEWKNGRTPRGDTLKKIADYFNVSVDYLLGKNSFDYPEEHSLKLIRMYIDGIITWSNNEFFNPEESSKIKEHLADFLLKYKELVNKICDLKSQNKNANFIHDNCKSEIEDLNNWIKLLPDYFFKIDREKSLLERAQDELDEIFNSLDTEGRLKLLSMAYDFKNSYKVDK